jgi:hypothetical protein
VRLVVLREYPKRNRVLDALPPGFKAKEKGGPEAALLESG